MDKTNGFTNKNLSFEEFVKIFELDSAAFQESLDQLEPNSFREKKLSVEEIFDFIVKNRIPLKFKTEKGELEIELTTSSILEDSELFFTVLVKSPCSADPNEPFLIDVRLSKDFQKKENFLIEMLTKLKELLVNGEITEFKQVRFTENSVSVEDLFPEFNL